MSKESLAIVDQRPDVELPERPLHPQMQLVRIASLAELEPYGQFSKWVDDHDILVFRKKDGEIKALSNICPHFGGPVGFHQAKDGVFTCLWHNYRFDTDGHCLTKPQLCLREYKLEIKDGGIWVQLVEKA